MRIFFLLIIILSTAFALTVTIDPYKELSSEFNTIEVYDYTDSCNCDCDYYHDYY